MLLGDIYNCLNAYSFLPFRLAYLAYWKSQDDERDDTNCETNST